MIDPGSLKDILVTIDAAHIVTLAILREMEDVETRLDFNESDRKAYACAEDALISLEETKRHLENFYIGNVYLEEIIT